MKIASFQADFAFCLEQAGRLLGEPAHPVYLDWDVMQLVRPKLRLLGRTGLSGGGALMRVDDSGRGHSFYVGAELYHARIADRDVPAVFISLPPRVATGDFWAVRERDYHALYRYVRQLIRQAQREPPPILDPLLERRLWDNTIGFLRRHRAVLRRYGVVAKRGVLLLGSPGNGKTMACRHLRAECQRRGLSWRTVTLGEFNASCEDGSVNDLFQPERPGIVLFDDCDALLIARTADGLSRHQSALLGQLDGVSTRHDVVYLFTSNVQADAIDHAVRRPGRVDVVLDFPRPDASLRRRLVVERWHEEILAALDVDEVAGDTADLSFAEIEEARKLLVLGYSEHGRWDWPAARDAIRDRCQKVRPRRPIGFATQLGAMRESFAASASAASASAEKLD